MRLDANNLEAQRDLIRYLMNAPGIVGGSERAAEQRVHALSAVDSIEGELAQAELLASRKKFDEANQGIPEGFGSEARPNRRLF